jgi:uncharacterized membrane protein YsdA (DUF1294 family)
MMWIAGSLLLINTLAFYAAWEDKRRARKKQWRIPERRLLLLAAFGGSVGLYAGFRLFRHKINHPKFMIGVPLILLLQLAVGVALFLYGDGLFALLWQWVG